MLVEMASLMACPNELLLSIISYLSQADLCTVCRVHRHLRLLTEPYLYAYIYITWKRSPPYPLTLLLRSILRRPQLATYVRTVSLTGKSIFGRLVPKLQVSESEMAEAMVFVADHTRVPYCETWLDELWDGTTDAYIAILLSLPLRLTSLVMEHDFFKESRLIGLVLRSTLLDQTADYGLRLDFQCLQTVSVERYTDFKQDIRFRNTADILPLFYLPSVRHISASIDSPAGSFTWPAPDPPSPSSLRSLILTSTREPFLRPLLSVTNQLQTLDWRWWYDPNSRDPAHTDVMDLTEFTTALSHVRNTLTELIVVAECNIADIEYPMVYIRGRGSLSTLKDFDKLTKFTVPFTVLMGFVATGAAAKQLEDALPPNLEILTLTDDLGLNDQYLWEDHQLVSVLQQWLGRYQISTPCLRGLSLSLQQTAEEWKGTAKNVLRELCEELGIRLESN